LLRIYDRAGDRACTCLRKHSASEKKRRVNCIRGSSLEFHFKSLNTRCYCFCGDFITIVRWKEGANLQIYTISSERKKPGEISAGFSLKYNE